MGFNPQRDAIRRAATRQKIIETGFRVFAERTIDAVNLTDVAEAAGLGMATVYRNFNSKTALVLEVNAWVWAQCGGGAGPADLGDEAAVTAYERFLDAIVDLYRHHQDILRFNQFFNIFVQREGIPPEQMLPFREAIDGLTGRFHQIYERARQDGTLRTDEPENVIFSKTLHLMLAAVTRYAVGLVYDSGIHPESELVFLKDMLLRTYAAAPGVTPKNLD